MRLTLSSASGTPEEKEAPAPSKTVGRASFWGLRIDASSRTVSAWLMMGSASIRQSGTLSEHIARCGHKGTLNPQNAGSREVHPPGLTVGYDERPPPAEPRQSVNRLI